MFRFHHLLTTTNPANERSMTCRIRLLLLHLMGLGKVHLEIASIYAYVQLKRRTPDLRASAKGQ